MAWDLAGEDPPLSGHLDVVSSYMEPGEGEGPVLPVEALYHVQGTLRLEGREFPVRGFLHHLQR